jgi:hypothetical protein
MKQRAKDILEISNRLFSSKRIVDSLWQEIALNFYPERADFTTPRNAGEEFSNHLFSSYPVIARRELGNMLAEFLRPDQWFSVHVSDDNLDKGIGERGFLENMTRIMRRAMYDPVANFVRVTAETDHDFATFGNGAISVTLNRNGDALLFKNHHLRDCAWDVNEEGRVDCFHRNWNPTARSLANVFPDTISNETRRLLEKEPHKKVKCRHIVLPSRIYEYKSRLGRKYKYVSLYVELDTHHILDECGVNVFPYVVPRWSTVSGTAYGVSMATAIVLPDGRTLQVVKRTMREAAEKYVDPPMIAITDALRGDIGLYPGGITAADMEYDERLGEVLRPVSQDRGGMPIGMEIEKSLKDDIRSGFFLDKMQLPEAKDRMTLGEFRRRVQEHIRAAAPITRPIQNSYNDPLCQTVFDILMENNVFPMEFMPRTLSERDVEFRFRSPLDELAEQTEADAFIDVMTRIVAPVAQINPIEMEDIDLTGAKRDAMMALGWKAKWLKPREEIEQKKLEMARKAEMQQAMEEAMSAGQAAEQGGKGASAIAEADERTGGGVQDLLEAVGGNA